MDLQHVSHAAEGKLAVTKVKSQIVGYRLSNIVHGYSAERMDSSYNHGETELADPEGFNEYWLWLAAVQPEIWRSRCGC